MKKLNKISFEEYIENDMENCLVIFSRKTCPICQNVHSTLAELEQEYTTFHFYHVDSEEENTLMNKFKIKGVPQVLFFKDGEEYARLVGNHDEDEYAEKIDELCD